MSRPILPRDLVAEHFSVAPAVLIHYESRGLVRLRREGDVEGYGPEEIRRLWSILSLHRDAGINLAGIEAILRLRAHLEELHHRLVALADQLHAALEAEATMGDLDDGESNLDETEPEPERDTGP